MISRTIIAAFLSTLPLLSGAVSLTTQFMSGVPYYFDEFVPKQKPWIPGRNLNLEEVFKNYQYYEVVVDSDRKGITVNHYIQGRKADSEQYELLPDGALRKK